MTLSLLLPWFPIVLAVGVGGRLLGRTRGFALGLVCALFWIVLTQASSGVGVWRDPWVVATIFIGAFTIFVMGGWSAGGSAEGTGVSSSTVGRQDRDRDGVADRGSCSDCEESDSAFRRIESAIDRYDDWLEEHRGDSNPWPEFGEFIRATLHECVRATHVKPFRVCSEGRELEPLRRHDLFTETSRLPVRRGIVGHVLTTARSYVAGDARQGELVRTLAEESDVNLAWCFPVTQAEHRLGVVTVGQLGIAPDHNRALLGAIERLVAQFWCNLAEALRSRTAGEVDAVSGLLTRQAFLHAANRSLRSSYDQGEPAAVVVIELGGLRQLSDSGHWDIADGLVGEVGETLRRKVRMDDRLGRFDGSRFIWLLRRVDSQLAALIAKQVMTRLDLLCGDESRWGASISIRCGLSGVGLENPDLTTLVSRALGQSRRARLENLAIATDLESQAVVLEVSP